MPGRLSRRFFWGLWVVDNLIITAGERYLLMQSFQSDSKVNGDSVQLVFVQRPAGNWGLCDDCAQSADLSGGRDQGGPSVRSGRDLEPMGLKTQGALIGRDAGVFGRIDEREQQQLRRLGVLAEIVRGEREKDVELTVVRK